jgi:predicted ferric reductase
VKKRIILLLLLIWLGSLVFTFLSVIKLTPLSLVFGKSFNHNFFQRLFALLAFTMLFYQIVIGMYMRKLVEKFGTFVRKFHYFQGIIIYILILFHPLLFLLSNFRLTRSFDPFYVFTDFCILCKTLFENYLTFGRISFWLISLTVIVAVFRSYPSLRNNWLNFHRINYLVFIITAIHAWGVGTDVRRAPYVWFFLFIVFMIVILLFVNKIFPLTRKNLPNIKLK